jgi:AsmA protein
MEAPNLNRSWLRVALWVVGALVALVLVCWGALAVFFPPARVRAMVNAQLATVLAREVRFADALLGLWPPVRLTVRQPALAEPGGFARGAAFQARSLHLDLDVLALLSRKVTVRRLVLDGPRIHLVLNPDGTTNFDGIMKPQPAGKPPGRAMDLAVRELRVRDGRVLVDDIPSSRRLAFGVESRVSLTAEGAGERFATAG